MNYLIKINGHLQPEKVALFGEFQITHLGDGTTQLQGELPDAAAIYGLMGRCRDYGLTLFALIPIEEPGGQHEYRTS